MCLALTVANSQALALTLGKSDSPSVVRHMAPVFTHGDTDSVGFAVGFGNTFAFGMGDGSGESFSDAGTHALSKRLADIGTLGTSDCKRLGFRRAGARSP